MVVGLGALGPEVDRKLGFDAQQVAPLHGPVIGKLVALQELIDEGGSLLGFPAIEKLSSLFGGGQGAGRVKPRTPQENAI